MELRNIGGFAFYKHYAPTELKTEKEPRRGEMFVEPK